MQADIGIIGLAVMGENLALNVAEHGFDVAVYNRTQERTERFLAGRAQGCRIIGAYGLHQLCESLRRPRKILLMVKAGGPVDDCIDELVPMLDSGDILIDGGNSHYPDTTRRVRALEKRGILYIGTGISGGEEGALRGPSIMPGGSAAAWPHVQPLFEAVAAKTPDGVPCCGWVGPEGAGHFVKMVHNGIEYGDMQLICEAYDLLKRGWNLTLDEIAAVFDHWNHGELNSYLIEITRDILAYRDERGEPVVEKILDAAGQKGTGKWTVQAALDVGQPVTLIGEAVQARCLSALRLDRLRAAACFSSPIRPPSGPREAFIADLSQALYASKIVSYAQGYLLMRAVADEQGWPLNYGGIALMWRGGCIIRSAFLDKIKAAFDRDAGLPNLLVDEFFAEALRTADGGWRRCLAQAIQMGIPVPAMSSALSFFDGFRSHRLPANLLQAQRDYFGAHTYERIDAARGERFHTNWTGRSGTTAAGVYEA